MIAASRAWVAMLPIALACVTIRVQVPPARGRRSSAQLARPAVPLRMVTASTWRSMICRETIEPPG